jgi:hypothetical protein
VLGDVLLGAPERLGEVVNAGLALAETVEQPDPGRLPDDTEALGDQVRERWGNGMGQHWDGVSFREIGR